MLALGAVTVLARGLGVNTAVFTIVRPLLLWPLPFPRAAELVPITPPRDAGRGPDLGSGQFLTRVDDRMYEDGA